MIGQRAELANWKSLKYVDLQDTRVTQKGVEALKATKTYVVILANASVTGQP